MWGSPTRGLWAARVGPMRAKRLLLTGDSLSGEQAKKVLEMLRDVRKSLDDL